VLQTEQQYTLDLGPLQFTLRIDRLDEIDGALVVIDYKSGRVSTGPALNEQLSAPQLPAYSLIRDDIAGVYYAQLRDDECKLVGLAGTAEQLTDGKNRQIKTSATEPSWSAQQSLWSDQLLAAAGEIAAGSAHVAPSANACRHCHLKPLCRVDEKRRTTEDPA
jgi:RecB family exonuclease